MAAEHPRVLAVVAARNEEATVSTTVKALMGIPASAGEHTVEFRFDPPITAFYVSLAAIVLGLGLAGFLTFSKPPAFGCRQNPLDCRSRIVRVLGLHGCGGCRF